MKLHVRDRMTQAQKDDLFYRRKSVRQLAKELGVTENYLTHAMPERAPKRNPKLLRATRRLFQLQVAREVQEGKHTVQAGSDLACISERTMYRRLSQLSQDKQKARLEQENARLAEQVRELTDERVA